MSIANNPQLLRESFIYFSKFPLLSGVLSSMFRAGKTSVTGYDALKSEITALAINSLVPEILNFLFSSNEDKLKAEIEDTKGMFMLLDYGQLSSSKDDMERKNDQFELGIIIARKLKPEDYDMAETLLLQDELLNTTRRVREIMLADSKNHPWVKQLDFPHRITPWYARELCNATGFSMNFSKSGIDMI
jgi:hypothetical protein